MELNELSASLGCADSAPTPAWVLVEPQPTEVPQLKDNRQDLLSLQVSMRNPSMTRNPIWTQPSTPSQGSSPVPHCCTDPSSLADADVLLHIYRFDEL